MESNQKQYQTNLTLEQVLNKANSQKKEIVKLSALTLEKPYQIFGWERINIKKPIARSVVVFDLGEMKVWGNSKCSKWSDDFLNELVFTYQLKLIYSGLINGEHNTQFIH